MRPYEPQGDADFWRLWEDNKNVFFKRCLKILNGDTCQAEDALSSAMLKAREKMINYSDSIHNFRGWALRLTENVCLDFLRKHRKLVSLDDFPDSFACTETDSVSVFLESADNYQSREALLLGILDTLNDLPLRLREPALLRFLYSASYRDIAGRLRISEENARKRIQEARSFLKCHHGEEAARSMFAAGEKAIEPDSAAMKRIWRDAGAIPDNGGPEIELYCSSAWIVIAPQAPGMDREIPVFLPLKPTWRGKGFVSIIRYIAKHPGGWKKQLELAQILYAVGIWNLAEQEFRHVLKKNRRSFPAWMLLGNILMESGRSEEADDLFRKAASLVYLDASRRYLAGMSAMCRGEDAEALAAFEDACRLSPSSVTLIHARGICLFRTGNYKAALRLFGDILAERPDDIVSLAYSCEAFILLDRPEEAGKCAERMLRNNPYDFFALLRKLELDRRKGVVKKKEWKRLLRLTERFEEIERIIRETRKTEMSQTSVSEFPFVGWRTGKGVNIGILATAASRLFQPPASLVYK